jgi:hypothetical protein
LLRDALDGSPPDVIRAADRIARGETVAQLEADLVVGVLASRMLSGGNFDGEELTGRGVEIDGIIGIVAQASESFFD